MTTTIAVETAQSPCGTCGECCRAFLVPVCGHDIWRISRLLDLRPEEFVVALRRENITPDGFILRPEGPSFSLALAKRGKMMPGEPCIFLIDFANGESRCGVYAERPTTCRVYPMTLRDGQVMQHPDVLCPPGAWAEHEPKKQHWFDAIENRNLQFDFYHQVLANWNKNVAGLDAGTTYTIHNFYDYLLKVYDALEAGPGFEPKALAAVTTMLELDSTDNGDGIL